MVVPMCRFDFLCRKNNKIQMYKNNTFCKLMKPILLKQENNDLFILFQFEILYNIFEH